MSREFPEGKAKKISKHLSTFSKPIIKHSRIYKYIHSEYHVLENVEKHYTISYPHHNISTKDGLSIISLYKNQHEEPLEQFPSRQKYHDIINRSEYIFDMEKMYQLCIVYEETSRKHTWTIEIRILHYNINESRLLSSISDTLTTLIALYHQTD